MQNTSHVDSWYAASANQQLSFPPLQGEVSADVCIIGGGYTGLSSAIHLRKAGYSVALLEANKIGWGASGRNGGHVGTGQRADQETLEKLVGLDHAKALWQLGLEAVDTVCDLVSEFQIDCELKTGNLHVASKAKEQPWLIEEAEHLQKVYDYQQIRYVDSSELADMTSGQGFHGGVLDEGSRHLHPLNYALGLAKAADTLGAELYEGSRVLSYTEGHQVCVKTDSGTVKSKYLVLACNGYLEKLEPRTAGRIMPINNYMLATEPLPEALARRLIRDDTSMSDSLFVIDYWKLSADNRMLFGGGESYSRRFPADIGNFVRKYMLRIYPELETTRIDYGWGGTLAITLNRMPDFGRLSSQVFYAHGYSGHGVPTATLAGKLLAEVIAGSAERFDVMASVPSRTFPGGTLLRWPGLVAGMLFYSLRDRLG
ncbi:FAD-binding oxidoreductase [Halieaceae bacterium IMCC8485]|jgi:gamma-glutamylputrescine oxidase|uniref:FAD-binding oxidoreductase n=1 Tax=Candidatus Seongchinamella marina TaxID=2518990 RepID=A0ABT3SZ30_9GAMM|nr:FAD-binding oxidoreductase [Candidatus Seongchinamella marina]MCX2975261.1 FAD-binding oxidoreductase [Candidatus Seongchinamella marina]